MVGAQWGQNVTGRRAKDLHLICAGRFRAELATRFENILRVIGDAMSMDGTMGARWLWALLAMSTTGGCAESREGARPPTSEEIPAFEGVEGGKIVLGLELGAL